MQLRNFHCIATARICAVFLPILLSTVSPAATDHIEQKRHLFIDFNSRAKAFLVSFDAQSVSNVTLLSDVRRIQCMPSGHFLYENLAKEWFRGHVSAPERKVAIPVVQMPACRSDDVADAVLSNGGGKIAWITHERVRKDGKVLPKSSLIVVDVATGSTGLVVRIEREGIMAAVSWSLDDARLAFYYGEGNAYEKDGYTIQLCDLTKAGELKQVAPPSLWLTPGAVDAFRSRPAMWSLDGTGLVFEGRYTKDGKERFSYVKTDGTGLMPVQGIMKGWSADGTGMLTLIGRKLMRRTPTPTSNAEELYDLPFSNIYPTKLSSDGKFIAFQTLLNPSQSAVDVWDAETLKTRRVLDCEKGYDAQDLVWIELGRP